VFQAPDDAVTSIFKDPDHHQLYLTAHVKDLRVAMLMRKSPRILLEEYTGDSDELTAPDWTSWSTSTLDFYQPMCTVADMFVRMSSWKQNRRQVLLFRIALYTPN
jgi:hypothetical protein